MIRHEVTPGATGINASRLHSKELIALVQREIPRPVSDQWESYGSMLLARSAGTLRSIERLDPGARTLDASALLRTLFDHVTLFAWVAINPPEHIQRWIASGAKHNLNEHKAWKPYGITLLDANAEQETIQLAASARGMPNIAQRAAEADDYWISRIPGIAPKHQSQSVSSFRSLYRTVFQLGSVATHPNVAQASHFVKESPTGWTAHWERTPGGHDHHWWAIGPYVLGLGLLVASEALGWPNARDIARATGREEALYGDAS